MLRDFGNTYFLLPERCGIAGWTCCHGKKNRGVQAEIRQLRLKGAISIVIAKILELSGMKKNALADTSHQELIMRIQQYIEACSGRDMSFDLLIRIFGYSKSSIENV